MTSLVEADSVEVLVIVDNEIDPLSSFQNPGVQVSGNMLDVAMRGPGVSERGGAVKELRMDNVCCGAHGLSLMITAVKGETRHTVLFDTGPEEKIWQENVKRLRADVSGVELIQLSHWHRDHSGGMCQAIRSINEAKAQKSSSQKSVTVDLHPNRPTYRGIMGPKPFSLEADPTFDEITTAGGTISKNADTHTVLDNMFLISGEIPRVTSYEKGLLRSIRFNSTTDAWEPDELIKDERFLMCNVKGKGIVVFTGCSHAGAINASKHAAELGGGAPLHAVMGGYHLSGPNEPMIQETVADFKKLDPKVLVAGHCSGWRVKFEIEKEMPGRLAPSFVGSKYVF